MDPILYKVFQVGILLIVGFCGGLYAKILKLPNVSGYILFGILLGPSMALIFEGFPGIISKEDSKSLSFLNDIALSFIAFSIGSEFRLKAIKKMGKRVGIITSFETLFAVSFVFILMFLFPKGRISPDFNLAGKNNISFSILLASLAASTAPAATVLVIRQYRAYGKMTKTVLPITALDDIFGIIIFGISLSVVGVLFPHKGGATLPLYYSIFKPFIEIFVSVGFGLFMGFLLSVISKKILNNKDELQGLSIGFIILTLGLCHLFNTFSGKWISFSPLLSNIFLGAMVSNISKNPQKTFDTVNDFSTPFFILFFTLAGASLDLGMLRQSFLILLLTLAYAIARGSGKYLGAFTGCAVVKDSKKVRNYIGFSLFPQGGVSIGLLTIIKRELGDNPAFGKSVEIISTIILLSILIYETSGPLFAKMAISKSGEMYALDKFTKMHDIGEKEKGEVT